jgi:hypothetical protein
MYAVITAWKAAIEGSSWGQIDAAWWTLFIALEMAEVQDRKDRS